MDSSTSANKNVELYQSFQWFSENVAANVLEATESFWENKFELMLLSLTTNESPKSDFASKGEIYFTVQIPSTVGLNPSIRISSEFARLFLHEFLGSNSSTFKLINLSELEIKILNSFAEFLYKGFENILVPAGEATKPKHIDNGFYNLTFLIKKEDTKPTKIVVSIPKNRVDAKKIEQTEAFTFDDFIKMSTFVNIESGKSKISLSDLKNLCPGDIILLENSNVNTMEIKTDNIKKTFKINPDPNLMLELDDDEDDVGANVMDNKNIWDDIQIEVSAEFQKIKMTLGDLKQISKGLVIDLGPVFHNKISLLVENKTVAEGELVIINDKYGVKIDNIISSEAKIKEQLQQAQPQIKTAKDNSVDSEMVQKMAQNTEGAEQEEFDYSDFENEDA